MKSIVSNDIQNLISTCFATDPALIETFHVSSGSLQSCVERTCKDLSLTHPSFKLYEIEDEGMTVGFFGKEHSNYLTTIFVHPTYRKKESIVKIWSLIQSNFDEDFYTAVYEKNKPAIRFFTRNGTQIDKFNTESGPSVAFKFLKGSNSQCH